jgi:TonB family protein
MRDWTDDIEQYHSGKLSPAEMHALEKKALTDPFLAEALEGAGQISPQEFSKDLAFMRANLHNNKKVVPIWTWVARIAAGLALIGLVSYLLIHNAPDSGRDKIAENKISKESPVQTVPPVVKDSITKPASAEAPASKGPIALNAEGAEAQGSIVEPSAGQVDSSGLAMDIRNEPNKLQGIAQNDQPSISIPMAAAPSEDERLTAMDRMEQSVTDKQKKVVTGTVIDAEDGRALPGVNVLVKGTKAGTITNEDGRYTISTDSLEAGLLFTYIGYETKEISAGSGANVDVLLNPDVAQLSEVVVVGYGGAKRDDLDSDPIIELAGPAGGRKNYKNYLETNLKYPEQALNNKVEGRVTVQFTVLPNGEMSDFKVLKGLGFGCDEEVIRLVKQGPKWNPSRKNTTAVSDKVKVRMKFNLPKK